MKKLNQIGIGLLVFTILGFDHGIARADSIVQITAEVHGLDSVSLASLPPVSTYWLAMPGAAFAPSPVCPTDSTLAAYSITDGIYLVDETGGQLPKADTVNDALEIESNAVVKLVNEVQGTAMVHALRGAHGMEATASFGSGGGFAPAFSFIGNTNLLWLQLTNVSGGTAYANLYNATDQVYAIWSTTNLAIPFTNWPVETEVFPTVSTTNRLLFSFLTAGRTNLFLRAQDWTGVYANGLPDWWTWYYFHTLDLSWNDEDANGIALGTDFTNHSDPDTIVFSLAPTNSDVKTALPALPLNVMWGIPGYVSVLVNSAALTNAVWSPYTNNTVTAALGADGMYNVSVGLRGFATNATETWETVDLTKNTVPPYLTLTSPASNTVSSLTIQFQGYADKALNALTYDLTNANGLVTNQPAFLTGQFYDTNLMAFTTNYFQSGDIYLAGGTNTVTLRATDWAGNQTNVTLSLDLPVGHPALSLAWPSTGTVVGNRSLTIQARANLPGLTVSATVGSSTVPGVVEANGNVWIQNVPLAVGTNTVTISTSDGNGNNSVTNLTVVANDLGLSVGFLGYNSELNSPFLSYLEGTINNSSLAVWVNGVEAGYGGNGTWEIYDLTPVIPVNAAGTAVFNVVVSNATAQVAAQRFYAPQPPMVALMSFSGHENEINTYPLPYTLPTYSDDLNWASQTGGSVSDNYGDGENLASETNGAGFLLDPPWNTDANDSLPWENADVSVLITNSFELYQNHTQTRTMIIPSGMQAAGTTNLYLVMARACEFSDANIQAGPPGYGDEYPEQANYGNNINPNLPYGGDVGLPPQWLQINGRTLANTGITNVLSSSSGGASITSVWGATILAAPVGVNLPLTIAATNVYQNHHFSFFEQVSNLTLRLKGANSGYDFTGQTNPVIVGEQVAMVAQLSATNQFMTNLPLSNFQWTIPGDAISNFVVSGNSGIVYTNFPTTNSNVFFYWVNGGSNRVIQCSATVNGQTITGSATFDVVRPTATITSQTGAIAIDTNYDLLNQNGSITSSNVFALHYGNPVDIPGIVISNANGTITISNFDSSWNIEWVQLVNSATNQRLTTDGTWHITTLITNSMLDTQYPESGDLDGTSDSPALIMTPPSSFNGASVSQNFSTWLMFKPISFNDNAISNSCFVPLRVVNWAWSASAYGSGANWALTSSNNIVNPAGTDSTIYPQWTDNATNHEYQIP